MITETCSCGAGIKTRSTKWWLYWRNTHTCPNQNETVMLTTEVSDTEPIGFQPTDQNPEFQFKPHIQKGGV